MIRIHILVILLALICFGAQAQEWLTLYTQAQKYQIDENYIAAVETGEQCLQTYLTKSGELNNNYASILRLLTTACFSSGDYEKGLGYGRKELTIRDELGTVKDLTYAGTLYNLASLHLMLEQYDEAGRIMEQTLSIYQKFYTEGEEEIVACQWKLASIKFNQGYIEVAQEIFRQSFEAYGSPEAVSIDYLNACYDYGLLLFSQKNFKGANDYFETVIAIYKALGYNNSSNQANVLRHLASCRYQLQSYEASAEYYKQALAIYQKTDNKKEIHKIQNELAICLQAMGRNNEAEQILSSLEADPDHVNVVGLINLALLNQQKHDYKKAEELYAKAKLHVNDSSMSYARLAEELGGLYTITGKYQDASDHYEEAEALIISAYGHDHPRHGAFLLKKAALLKKQRKYSEAKKVYGRVKVIFEKEGAINDGNYATLFNGMGTIHQEEGNYTEAEKLFRKSLDLISQTFGINSGEYSVALNNLASLLQLKGYLLEAKDLFSKVAAGIKAQPELNKSNYAVALDNLAAVNIQTGNYESAYNQLEESLNLKATIHGEDHSSYASGLLNLARLEQAKGHYTKAEPLFKRAVALQKEALGLTHPDYANVLNGMALLYQAMGNFDEARDLMVEARNIYKNSYGVMHPEYATTLENLSTLHHQKGEHSEARVLLEEALKIDEAIYGTDHPSYGTTLHNLASLYQDLHQYEKAEPLYQKALNIDEKTFGKKHPSYASTLYNIAVLKQDLKKFDEAEEIFKQVIEIRKEILGTRHPDYAYSLYGLAAFYHLTQKKAAAEGVYRAAINLYLEQIEDFFPSLSDMEKSAFYTKIKPVFEAFQDFSVEYYLAEPEKAGPVISTLYNLQLATKALLLNASNKVRDRILSSGDDDLISTYYDWINGKEQLVKFYTYTKQELQKENVNLKLFENKLNELEKTLSHRSSLFAKEFEKETYTWKDVQNGLQEKEAAVEIVRIKKRYIADSVMYVALVITKGNTNHPTLVVLNKGNQLESREFNYYRNAIKFTIEDRFSYNSFWQPIAKELSDVKLTFVSSDGIYNKINFNTLRNVETNKYLIDEIDIKHVSNTKEIIRTPIEYSRSKNNAHLLGSPDYQLSNPTHPAFGRRADAYGFNKDIIPELPGTKTEIEQLSQLLEQKNWSINRYTDGQATEENMKLADSPTLLHIASHGFFLDDLDIHQTQSYGIHLNGPSANPLFRSGLLLTGASDYIFRDELTKGLENGILTAYEAMNLNLDNTDLVVLSACETGLGKIKNGEGVYGLQRAFVIAGANAVIMSLWKVDDQTTQQLMSVFYKNWLNGDSKLEAFKKAQLKIKELYGDPYYWGPFIIIGN